MELAVADDMDGSPIAVSFREKATPLQSLFHFSFFFSRYDEAMLKTISFLLALTASASFAADLAKDQAEIWNLEKAYWEYVKTNDLEKYRALWHDDFVGWPFVSTAPVRKDHITDWITNNTSKGLTLRSYTMFLVVT